MGPGPPEIDTVDLTYLCESYLCINYARFLHFMGIDRIVNVPWLI